MIQNCSLIKAPDGSGFTPESIEGLQKKIRGAFLSAILQAVKGDPSKRNKRLKRLVKQALEEIGDSYTTYPNEVEKLIKAILEERSFQTLKNFIPEVGIRNTFQKSLRAVFNGNTSKETYMEDEDESDVYMPSFFLDRVFGSKATLKNEIKQKATHILLNNFIIDREHRTIVENITEANKNVRIQKNQLFQNILKTMAKYSPDLEGLHRLGDLNQYVLYDEQGQYTGVLDNPDIDYIINSVRPFDTWFAKEILDQMDAAQNEEKLANQGKTNSVKEREIYNAYKDWFVLYNYDNFTKLLLGDAVIIHPDQKKAKFKSGDGYSFSNKSANLLTSWRPDNGDVDLKVEISALAQSLVESTPFRKFGTYNKSVNQGAGLYLRFEDFYRVMTKLKEAIYKLASSYLIDDEQGVYGETYKALTSEEKTLVKGKSLRQIINSIRRNPQVYGRLAMKIIITNAQKTSFPSQYIKDLGMDTQDIDRLWSIYTGFFDDTIDPNVHNESIFDIQRQYDHNANNYYALMTQVMDSMFTVNYIQYNNEFGNVVVRTLKQQGYDNTRQIIENNIYNTNSKRITKFNFESLYMKPYEATPFYETDVKTGKQTKLGGINFKIGDVSIQYNMNSVIFRDKNGTQMQSKSIEDFAKSDLGMKFIDDLLHINLRGNTKFQNAINIEMGGLRDDQRKTGKDNKNISLPYTKIFNLATEVYFNRYLSNVVLKDATNYKKITEGLDAIYGSSAKKPGFNSSLREMKLLSENSLPVLEDISRAHTLATGQASSAQVRDADGNLLSQQTLSRHLGALGTQWDNIIERYKKRNEERKALGKEPMNTFSLLDEELYQGHYTIKELKSLLGNKAATKFTVSEFMQACFLHTFVGSFINDPRKIISQGIVGFLPSVNSDKNTIGQIFLDLSKPCNKMGGTSYISLNLSQILDLIQQELGDSYSDMLDVITEDFLKLSDYVVASSPEAANILAFMTEKGITNLFDPRDHFAAFNEFADRYGYKAKGLLDKWTLQYNNTHNDNIVLTDQVHYIKGKDGHIVFNNTTLELVDRYSNRDKLEKFMQLKRAEVFHSLLDERFQINLYNGDNTSPAAAHLRDEFKDWVHHGNMTIGKIHYNGKTYDIASRTDLEEFQAETGLDVSTKFLASGQDYTFELHPMLDKYNSLDYLFTQEFMIAGVGSHIAHKAKPSPDPLKEEAARFLAQHKRNVSYTAAMHEFQLGQITGIPSEYNMAMMEDIPAYVYTMAGDRKDDADSFDGATFVNPWVIEWENNSLNSAKAGIDKKPFVHFYDERTRTGGIIKTAGFGVTNDRVRTSKFYRDMIYNMTKRQWKDQNGQPLIMTGRGIMQDFNGKAIDYGPIYYRNGNRYFRRLLNPDSYLGNNIYQYEEIEVDENGNDLLEKAETKQVKVDNNYDLWRLFGGANSMELLNGTLQFSEKSRILTAMAANNYGNRIKTSTVTYYDQDLGVFPEATINYTLIKNADGTNTHKFEIKRTYKRGNDTITDTRTFVGNDVDLQTRKAELILGQHDLTQVAMPNLSINPQTANEVWQPLKHSDIHYMPTSGAVKQGIGNVNSNTAFFSKMKRSIPDPANPNQSIGEYSNLNFMKVKMLQAGIQLDKEHHADNSVLSLMTQVISAACAKGFKIQESSNLYNALYELSKIGTEDFRDELGKLNIVLEDPEQAENFRLAAAKIVLKTMMNSTSQDGDMVQSIARELILKMSKNKDFTITNAIIKGTETEPGIKVPWSSPEIFRKVISALSSSLTKQSIKSKIPGILSVLCPAHNIVKFYKYTDDKGNVLRVRYDALERLLNVEDSGNDDVEETIDQKLEELQAKEPAVQNTSEIEMGFKYLATHADGSLVIYHVVRPNTFNPKPAKYTTSYGGKPIPVYEIGYANVKKALQDGTILSLLEWIKDGQDLKSYNVRFTADGQSYQMADLDIVQDYFAVKDLDNPELKLNQTLRTILKYSQPASKNDKFNEFCARCKKIYEKSNHQKVVKDQLLEAITLIQQNRNHLLETNPTTGQPVTVRDLLVNAYGSQGDRIYDTLKPILTLYGVGFMNRMMQLSLNSISPKNESTLVFVNGKPVMVDKDSIKIQSYGCIMPKVFKSNFGLDDYESIQVIKNDPDYFLKKLVRNATTKVENQPIYEGLKVVGYNDNYHLELKRADGNHLYIRNGRDGSSLTKKLNIMTERIDGKLYRISLEGDKKVIMYELFTWKEGDLEKHDEVYLDDDGNEVIVTHDEPLAFENSQGEEVSIDKVNYSNGNFINIDTNEVVTPKSKSGIQHYLDTQSYFTINVNQKSSDKTFADIVNRAYLSKNAKAQKFAKLLVAKGDVKSQKKLAFYLNNYEKALLDDKGFKHLREEANAIKTSFLTSLEIIAARIPAQSQQSFMSMDVEEFDNPDVNSAYVSIFQFYLQGSDLDIDAVSMQTFDIDKDGRLQGHSPYYRLDTVDMRKASEQLPFPTNIKIEETKARTHEDSIIYELINGQPPLIGDENSLFTISKENGKIRVNYDLNNPEKIRLMADFLTGFNKGRAFRIVPDNFVPLLTAYLNTTVKGMEEVTDEDVRYVEQSIKNIIDNHNTYIKRSNPNKREQIINNYIVTQLLDIIKDPVNRLLADSSVDVVTGPVKDLSKLSPKATVQDTFTPGNVVNKFQSIVENMVGKDGIAICATGLKSFFALTELEQLMLEQGRGDELMFSIEIGGKEYTGLANGFSSKYISEYEGGQDDIDALVNGNATTEQKLKFRDYLFDLLWAEDAANNMSAFLGLSTDNAKELVLAKINAGTATMGMYLYGLSIGMPVADLYKMLTSPLAFRLTELTKGDTFNLNPGTFNVLGALRYLRSEPTDQLSKFNYGVEVAQGKSKPVDYLNKLLLEELQLIKEAREIKSGKKESKTPITDILNQLFVVDTFNVRSAADKEAVIKENLNILVGRIRELRQRGNNEYAKEPQAMVKFNQAVDFLLEYIGDVAMSRLNSGIITRYGMSNLFADLDKLAMGADEMKELGKILRANQEIKTRPDELIQQVANIEECITRRLSRINSFNTRYGKDNQIKTEWNGKDLNKEKNLRVDLIKFFTNEAYAQEKISQYDAIKQSYNPLRVIHDVPHYRGYWEAILCSSEGSKKLTVKQRILSTKVADWITTNGVKDLTLVKQIHRNAETTIDVYFRRKWMREYNDGRHRTTGLTVKIPASTDNDLTYIFSDAITLQAKPNYFDTFILLGTPLGDANFKYWMENNVIPKLKEDPKFKDNKFIQGLQPVLNMNTQIGIVSINKGLNINMLPDKGDTYSQDLLREYRDSFNEFSRMGTIDIGKNRRLSYGDLFYLYSLISTNGRVGPHSLHGIMADYTSDMVIDYRNSISDMDETLVEGSEEYEKIISTLTDEVLAPFSDPWKGGSKTFKYKDKNSDQVTLYRKKVNSKYSEEETHMANMRQYEETGEEVTKTTEINGYKPATDLKLMLRNADYNYFTIPERIGTNYKGYQHKDFNIVYEEILNNKGEIEGLKLISVASTKYNGVIDAFIKKLKDTNGMLPEVIVQETKDGKTIEKHSLNPTMILGMLETALNECL